MMNEEEELERVDEVTVGDTEYVTSQWIARRRKMKTTSVGPWAELRGVSRIALGGSRLYNRVDVERAIADEQEKVIRIGVSLDKETMAMLKAMVGNRPRQRSQVIASAIRAYYESGRDC
jgi:hypothetical protein